MDLFLSHNKTFNIIKKILYTKHGQNKDSNATAYNFNK